MMVHQKTGLSHVELTGRLLEGKIDILTEDEKKMFSTRKSLPEIIENRGLDPVKVASLILGSPADPTAPTLESYQGENNQKFFNPKMYLNQIIHGEIDCDQIDYLMRDSHYTGIAHGIIDVDRLIQTMEIYNNDLVIHRRGLSAVEGMLVARSLMYSSIYFHKTVRIAELMLARAVEHAWTSLEKPPLERMIDYDLLNYLDARGNFSQEIVRKLKFRRVYKKVLSYSTKDLSDEQTRTVVELSDWEYARKKEDEICERLAIPKNHLIIDVPKSELAISEPRIKRTQVKIKDRGLRPLSSYSPLARALQLRPIPDWEIMVAADPAYLKKSKDGIEKMLFG